MTTRSYYFDKCKARTYEIRLKASHACHSRQTESLTGNPGVPDASGRRRKFPIGRFAAVGDDTTASIRRISRYCRASATGAAHQNSPLSFVNWMGQVTLRVCRTAREMVAATSGSYVEKTLSYRRADWLETPSGSATLESFLKQALTKLQTVGHTAVARESGQVLSCAKREIRQRGGIFLHVTAITPGGEASVISSKDTDAAPELDILTVTPPIDNEFVDGDVFLLVRKDSICVCSNAIRDGTIAHYFYKLFEKAKLTDQSTKFHIVNVADIDKVKFIQDHKLKSITLNASLYKASNDALKNAKRMRGAPGAVAKFLKALLGRDNDVNNDSINVHITIETDGRVRKHLSLGEHRLESWALDLVKNEQSDDSYTIVTADRQIIRPNELKMQKLCNIHVKGNSVDRECAWKELLDFYKDLCEKGAVEE